MLLFLQDLKDPGRVMALIFGAILGPLTFMLTPDWTLVITGLVGGTLAWFIDRKIKAKRAKYEP
ncbi:MAG: hypothetical protein COB46_05165 [Rhodospirillaceae bacterium]|nr:MAG: hypothetical protein COB46_05165 [Rhodospirillaceae bacterium]